MKNNIRVQSISFLRIMIVLSLYCITQWQVTAQTPVQTPTSAQTYDDKSVQAAVNARVAEIERAISEGHLNPAFDQLNEIIKANPNNANAYVQRASIHVQFSKFDLAQIDLKKALELDSRNAKAYAIRGAVASILGDDDGCIADSTKAIEFDPTTSLAYYDRGTIYFRRRNYTQALDDLNNAVKFSPLYSDAYLNRGVVRGLLGDTDGKIDDLVWALELNPSNKPAQSNLTIMIGKFSPEEEVNAIKQRYEGLGEKYRAVQAQNAKLVAVFDSKPGSTAACQSLKETLVVFGEEKAAWRRATLLKHLGNLSSLQDAIKYVNDVGASIADLDKIFANIAVEHKCK